MDEPSYGWLSLLPPVVAILLAVSTKRVFESLLAGIVTGALVLHSGQPIAAISATCEDLLWPAFTDPLHLRVFVFTAAMGAMVGVMRHTGGFESLIRGLAPLASSPRAGQLTVWSLGLIVFFDDYANSLLLGNTMRPLADRLKISREKLAYLVDSTAAPVSGLALISTWVAGEIGFIQAGFENLSAAGAPDEAAAVDGFGVFVATIPYRFYVLWTLLFVPVVAIMGRELGPMWRAEQDARTAADDLQTGSREATTDRIGDWRDAVVPIVAVVGVTVVLILLTGSQALQNQPHLEKNWLNTFGKGDSYLALVYGSLAGLLTAILLACGKRLLTWEEAQEAAFQGARQVLPALFILWFAWALSGLTDQSHLGTGQFLASLLQNSIDVRWMPTAVFLLASLVAFATGTSWGTMAILMPLVISVTAGLLATGDEPVEPLQPLLIATIGSVLAGAIFGDHCSPISDTTVLSSQASGCNHIAHVRTQLPYALLTALVSIVCGTIPVGFGAPVGLLFPLGIVTLIVLLRMFGKPVS